MPQPIKRAIYMLSGIVGCLVLLIVSAWTYILLTPTPLSYAWVARSPWPVACSTRGCVTTRDWNRQYTLAESFAAVTGAPKQTELQAFTTVLRQHLLAHAFLKSPITITDARRYRQQVLKLSDDRFLASSIGLSAEEYDRYVIMPFLQQEALRKTREIKESDELYKTLSEERFVLLLPWSFKWDTQKGEVIPR